MGDTGGAQASATNGVAMAMTAAGGLTSALGQYQTGRTNRAIANSNATIARNQERETLANGEFAANRVEMKARLQESAQRAEQAGGGTVAGAGTGGLVTAQTEGASAMDELMIKRNAARAALGYESKAVGDEIEGDMADKAGKMGALSTLLNTGSQEWLQSDPNYHGYHGSGLQVSRG